MWICTGNADLANAVTRLFFLYSPKKRMRTFFGSCREDVFTQIDFIYIFSPSLQEKSWQVPAVILSYSVSLINASETSAKLHLIYITHCFLVGDSLGSAILQCSNEANSRKSKPRHLSGRMNLHIRGIGSQIWKRSVVNIPSDLVMGAYDKMLP